MCELKSQPLQQIMRMVHPDLYRIDNMTEQVTHIHTGVEYNDAELYSPSLLIDIPYHHLLPLSLWATD